MSRTLVWDGCLNVRDLGGLPTEDGARTRFGVVIRADNVRRLREYETLRRHGVTRVVDLRHADELALDPGGDLPAEHVNVPVIDFDPKYFADLDRRALASEPGDYLEWSYLDFLERFRANFGAAVRAVAGAEGTVCVHCMGGRDRTGLVTALLLRLAGVSREAAAEDYWLSEEALAEDHQRWVDEAPDEQERRRRLIFAVAPARSMLGVLRELERRYGSVRDYLVAAGVPEADLDALRARLREGG
jgi:protein tyrosine/serine phosphatase